MSARRIQIVGIAFSLPLLAALLAGCMGGGSKPGWSLPGAGSVVDFDPHAKRLEVRPSETSLVVGRQLVLLATIYDENNKPRTKRRVDWKIEGPGIILEVDEGGYLQGRGFKEGSNAAVSFTNTAEHPLPPGVDNPLGQIAGPGQTWCVISSAVEGQTIVHAYAPEIADPERNRVVIKANWVDARWQFPEASSARAGSEIMLQTRISRQSNQQPATNYKVRYSLSKEGPLAALAEGSIKNGKPSSQQMIVPADAEGIAKVVLGELKPDFGASVVNIDVLRPDATQAEGFVIVASSKTKVDWQAPEIKLGLEVPKTTLINRAFPITYSIASVGTLETMPIVLKTAVPPGLELISATPKATADGAELLWSLPSLPGGKQQTVQAVFRPTRTGDVNVTASAGRAKACVPTPIP